MPKRLIFVLVLTLLLLGLLAPSAAASASSGVPSDSRGPNREGSVQMPETERSRLAVQMLEQTDLAREAIQKGAAPAARDHLKRAIGLAEKLQSNAQVQADGNLVPVYNQLQQASVVAPVLHWQAGQPDAAAAGAPDPAEGAGAGVPVPSGARENKGAAARQWSSSSLGERIRSGGETIRPTGPATMVAVDVTLAKNHLEAAATELENRDLSRADAALVFVQDGIFVIPARLNAALAEAREHLSAARSHALDGDYDAATQPLKAAAQALASYQNGPQGDAARRVQRQIFAYLESRPKNHANEVTRIDSWWDQVTGWMLLPARSGGDAAGMNHTGTSAEFASGPDAAGARGSAHPGITPGMAGAMRPSGANQPDAGPSPYTAYPGSAPPGTVPGTPFPDRAAPGVSQPDGAAERNISGPSGRANGPRSLSTPQH